MIQPDQAGSLQGHHSVDCEALAANELGDYLQWLKHGSEQLAVVSGVDNWCYCTHFFSGIGFVSASVLWEALCNIGGIHLSQTNIIIVCMAVGLHLKRMPGFRK